MKVIPPVTAINETYQVRFKTSNSHEEHEVLLRRKSYPIFSKPSFEVYSKMNMNETICKDEREKLMKKILEKVFQDYKDYEYEDVTFGFE